MGNIQAMNGLMTAKNYSKSVWKLQIYPIKSIFKREFACLNLVCKVIEFLMYSLYHDDTCAAPVVFYNLHFLLELVKTTLNWFVLGTQVLKILPSFWVSNKIYI